MKDDLRLVPLKDAKDPVPVPYVCNDRDKIQVRELLPELEIRFIYAVLAVSKKDELLWRKSADLPAELGSNRTARACHKYNMVLEIFAHRLKVDFDLISLQ